MSLLTCCVILRLSSDYRQVVPRDGAQIVYQAPFASLSQRQISRAKAYFLPSPVRPTVSFGHRNTTQLQRRGIFRQNQLVMAQQSQSGINHHRNAVLNSQHLQKQYSGSIISVNVGETSANSRKTSVNLLNTVAQYSEGQNIKNVQSTYLANNSSIIVFQGAESDREHLLITPIQKGLNIKNENGYCFSFLRSHHKIHTQLIKKDGFLWTFAFSYVQNKNTLHTKCDLYDTFFASYITNLTEMY